MKPHVNNPNKKFKADEDLEDCASLVVLTILLTTLDARDRSELSDVRGNRKYRIVFETGFSGLAEKIQIRQYTDDAEVMAKLATLVQQRVKFRNFDPISASISHVSISFEPAFRSEAMYGKLLASARKSAWTAIPPQYRRRDGCYEFDFSDDNLIDLQIRED